MTSVDELQKPTQPDPKPPEDGKIYSYLPDGRMVFWVDSHILSTWTTCETMFDYRINQHWRSKGRIWVVDLGSWWSLVLSDFYEHMALARTAPTLAQMQAQAIMHWRTTKMDDFKLLDTKRYEKFVEAVLRDNMPAGILRLCSDYYTKYAIQDSTNWRIVATEAGFGLRNEVYIAENSYVKVFGTGRPDLLVADRSNFLFPVDHKLTSKPTDRWLKSWKPHMQTKMYVHAAQELSKLCGYSYVVDRCLMNGCGRDLPVQAPRDLTKPITPRFGREYVSYSVDEITEWRYEVLDICTDMRRAIENNKYRHVNGAACHSQFNRPCAYRDVCALRPSDREQLLASRFLKGEAWVPYEVDDE